MASRALYWLLTHLAAPLVAALDAWRAIGDPEQRGRVRERLGWSQARMAPGSIWVHAVSVGEAQAAAALVRELQVRMPGVPVLVTTVTATGAARARAIFGERVPHAYLPYDLPGAVRRLLDRVRGLRRARTGRTSRCR